MLPAIGLEENPTAPAACPTKSVPASFLSPPAHATMRSNLCATKCGSLAAGGYHVSIPVLRRCPVILLHAAFVCSRVAADEQKKASPTKEQVAQWVRDLGHDDFEQTGERLETAVGGRAPGGGALKEALKSDDVEVKRRSQELLDKFKWGIYPDTPAKIVEMIQRYQAGADADAKGAIVQELLDAGEDGRTAFARISAAEDKNLLARSAVLEAIQHPGQRR